ncbi:MAG: type II CAAX endopeptidase family protein, partial [Planctomycetota bacterium]|nr:type II CAAX endopeptidase family protein [Planctomycetota bacterium]
LARSLEYCLVQVLPWLTIGPLTLQFLGGLGEVSGTSAILIAIGTVVLTAFLVGGVRLWLETWLRMKFSLRTLRNIQSACMLTGMVLMACLFAVCMAPSTPELFIDICRTLPDWVMFLPGSWPIAMSVYGWLVPAIAVAVTAAAFWLTLSFTSQILRSGFMQSGGTDPGSRGASFDWKQSTKRLGIIGKDLLMLTRDRVLMVQTLAAPIFIIGLQVLINPSLGELGNTGAEIGYFIAVFSAMGGCFQVLSGEGRALWMLYTMPTPIAEMLAAKTRIWACIAVGFGCATLLAFAGNREELTLTALGTDLLLVGCGCWCVAHIAAGMRVLTANPAADHIPRQPKARHLYLFFFFGGSYLTVLVQPDLAQQLAGALIFATFSYAIWQRALDRIPWLLDPVDEPRKQLQVFDGGAALLVFFVLQAVIAILWVFFADMEPGEQPTSALTFAFMLSGAITVALFVSNLTRRGITLGDLFAPDARPQGRLASCLTGTVLGIALGGIGLLYLGLVSSNGWFEIPKIASEEYAVLFVLTVVAAPVIEEILFRGIVFGAFARSVRTSVAVIWSSLLFAAVHPVASWPPVFLMGLAAAILYRRSGFLPAAMLLHASYNFVVLTYQ